MKDEDNVKYDYVAMDLADPKASQALAAFLLAQTHESQEKVLESLMEDSTFFRAFGYLWADVGICEDRLIWDGVEWQAVDSRI